MTHKYQVIIWWSEDDDCFLAMAPQLPRCIADGATPETALAALHEVMDLWMEMAHEKGWTIPEPPGKMMAVANEFDWGELPPAALTQVAQEHKPVSKFLPPKTKSPRLKTRKSHVETKNTV